MSSRFVAVGLGLALSAGGPGVVQAHAPEVPVEETEPPVTSGDELEVAEVDEAPTSPPSEGEGDLAEHESDTAEAEPESDLESNPPVEGEAEATEVEPTEPSHPQPPAPDFDPDAGFAPGGYYGKGVVLERAPPDGHRHIVAGSILVPIGFVSAVSSGVGTWMTVPDHCAERLEALGRTVEDPENCRPVFVFNVVRTTYGSLMLISGAVILSLGLLQRQRYRKWRLEHGMRAWVQPPVGGRGGAAGFRFRF
ncbi:MAG: hypothetical protein AAF799_02035 [Myxococcota bacterium]